MDAKVLTQMSYGVYVVTSLCGEKPAGCIANSAIQVTYDTIAVSIHHENLILQTNVLKNPAGLHFQFWVKMWMKI